MILTDHFTLEELTASHTAGRLTIDNTPCDRVLGHLLQLAHALEQIRALLDAPITISSGFRCLALNRAIGSRDNSAHIEGWAADFIAPRAGTPLQIVRTLARSAIDFDQLIQEGTWVHVSIAPTLRRQVLTAHFDANGKATYTPGA